MKFSTSIIIITLLFNSNTIAKITHITKSPNQSNQQNSETKRLPKIAHGTVHGIREMRGSLQPPPVLPSKLARPVATSRKYLTYESLIKRSADKWNIAPSLIVAVMHAESYFNPQAVSHASAIGLMQVLVNGGAAEVSQAYFSNRPIRTQDLLIPEVNIDVGTAYLHLLNERYLKTVRSKKARKLLSIAAYNCGLTNLMKYSIDETSLERFISKINQLTEPQVYILLTQTLRISETRAYVEKVTQLQNKYQTELNW